MAYQTLGKLERGESRLRWEVAQRLAKALKCTPFELVPEGEGLSNREIELLRLLNSMNDADADRWLKLGKALMPSADDEPASKKRNAA